MKIDFGELDRARHERGHTIEDACQEIGVSWQTWKSWVKRSRDGRVTLHRAQGIAAKKYAAKVNISIDSMEAPHA